MCVRHGADIVGFVVDYPRPVPWNLRAADAKGLISAVPSPAGTCIVTGGPPGKVLRLALELQPDYIQLHGGESLADTARLADALRPRGVKIIKTVFPDTSKEAAIAFCAAGVYALLLDPRAPENAATGGTADLDAYVQLRRAVRIPVILAGGIHHGNVAEIVRLTKAPAVDLMTGVERCPGMKDEAKVVAFFHALRGISLFYESG